MEGIKTRPYKKKKPVENKKVIKIPLGPKEIKIDHRKSEYRGLDKNTEDILLHGTVQDLLKMDTRPNPYDVDDSWKNKGGNIL